MSNDKRHWRLRSVELNNCSVYREGEGFDLRLPEISAPKEKLCAMPVASFLPEAVKEEKTRGEFNCGYQNCSCKWAFHTFEPEEGKEDSWTQWIQESSRAKLGFLHQLPKGLAKVVWNHSLERSFVAGEMIYSNDHQNNAFHILKSGRARMKLKGPIGNISETWLLGNGDCFGEIPLLAPDDNFYRVEALEDCIILTLSAGDLFSLMQKHAEIAVALFRLVARNLKRLRKNKINESEPGISGDLTTIGFIDLSQAISATSMSGLLVLRNGEEKAHFGFSSGKLLYGKCRDQNGMEAVNYVLGWNHGKFHFFPKKMTQVPNMSGDTMGILLETIRRMDESTSFIKDDSENISTENQKHSMNV